MGDYRRLPHHIHEEARREREAPEVVARERVLEAEREAREELARVRRLALEVLLPHPEVWPRVASLNEDRENRF